MRRAVLLRPLLLLATAACGALAPAAPDPPHRATVRPSALPPGPLTTPASTATAASAAAHRPRRLVELEGWDRLPPQPFEQLALSALPAHAPTELDAFLFAELEGALGQPGPRAVRAAVLLGRSGTHAAGEALLRRLERRVLSPARNQDAADVVAAGALERLPDGSWTAARLAALAHGPSAHPDLEVRVACAAAALQHGRDEVVPFLLQVLRIGTPDGADDVRDFPVSETTTWARSEAAFALARRAGVEDAYPADGPLDARDRAAAALEDVLGDVLGDG